jgi:hypothetical protein
MTVLLAVHMLPVAGLVEVREACKTLGLATADWTGGAPRVAPCAAIGGLLPGMRRIPDDLVALVEAAPGLPVVLCAQEPLVKPLVTLDDGRIYVVAPPIHRVQIVAALRAAIQSTAVAVALDAHSERRFEALRRSHWVAWTRGRSGPAISLHEQRGATIVVGGESRDRAAIAAVMVSAQGDIERESALGNLPGTVGVAHLTPDAREWVMYWPAERCPLWLYSPDRAPTRWNAARAIAEVAERRLLRLPAFPSDQLVAVWSDTAIARDAFAPVHECSAEGGSQVLVGLDGVAGQHGHVTGFVVEVR